MPNAIDVITFIGIPLAVLGVLPIIYTTFTSFITYRRIHHALRRNNVSPRTRGSLMSRVMELDFDRHALAPLPRTDSQYWKSSIDYSNLRGGSWSLFNWNKLPTGRTMYRVMYEDEIRQPQAEVDFEALVAFLLDRGAVPVPEGWAKLRVSGLWTPPGTRLLEAPEGRGTVLAITTADESDGHLSLKCWWEERWGGRGVQDLPPYWMSVKRQRDFVDKGVKKGETNVSSEEKATESDETSTGGLEQNNGGSEKNVEVVEVSEEHSTSDEEAADILCFRLSSFGITESYTTPLAQSHLNIPLETPHLKMYNDTHSPSGLWFACLATALSQRRSSPPSTPTHSSPKTSQTALWSYTIPPNMISFAPRPCIPSGLLVLLSLCSAEKAPDFRSTAANQTQAIHTERHIAFTRRLAAQAVEAKMAPAQREAARIAREALERQNMVEDMMRERGRMAERSEQEVRDALASVRWDARKVVDTCCEPLKGTVVGIDGILWRMGVDEQFAARLAEMMDRWKAWTEGSGITPREFERFKGGEDQRTMLLIAAKVVVCLAGAFEESSLGTPRDMRDSMRSWARVRLG